MKLPRIIGIGVLGAHLATAWTDVQAEADADKYAPLRAALAGKKQEATAKAEEAGLFAGEYQKFLQDSETREEERSRLRMSLIQERVRIRQRQNEAVQYQMAIQQLRWISNNEALTLAALQEAYHGLDELAAKGQGAWEQIVYKRDASMERTRREYAKVVAERKAAFKKLNTVERANGLLLNAINSHRNGVTDAEFHVSLKLRPVKSAAELGFGLRPKSSDQNGQAQATLIALIGYSQFFWDYYTGVRNELGENKLPNDHTRNAFGVADGGVLTSNAVAHNRSSLYFLSDEAKEKFNRRIRAIWGTEGSVAVSTWDQSRANSFYRACKALSTRTERALSPNQEAFELLARIDRLIAEKEEAAQAIQRTRAGFVKKRYAEARKFAEKAGLSTSQFNAEIWSRDSEQTTTRFEAAHQFLSRQLTESLTPDWTPDAKGIIASVRTLRKAHRRYHSVWEVKVKLSELLR